MSLEMFRRQIENRQANSTNVPESTHFQDLVESLKHNREIKGLTKYVGEHILTTLNTVRAKGEESNRLLGRKVLEKLEKLVKDFLKFREDNYKNQDALVQVMLEFKRRK